MKASSLIAVGKDSRCNQTKLPAVCIECLPLASTVPALDVTTRHL
jgi:hypothetical protein